MSDHLNELVQFKMLAIFLQVLENFLVGDEGFPFTGEGKVWECHHFLRQIGPGSREWKKNNLHTGDNTLQMHNTHFRLAYMLLCTGKPSSSVPIRSV